MPPAGAGAAPPPLWTRDSSCALSWFAIESGPALRAIPRRVALRWLTTRLCRAFAVGAAGAAIEAAGAVAAGAAAGARDDGVMGAAVCAHTGAAIARAATTATPFKRCFMPLSSVAVPDWNSRLQRLAELRVTLAGPGPETTIPLLRSRGYATSSVAYPTSPPPDNMIRAAE